MNAKAGILNDYLKVLMLELMLEAMTKTLVTATLKGLSLEAMQKDDGARTELKNSILELARNSANFFDVDPNGRSILSAAVRLLIESADKSNSILSEILPGAPLFEASLKMILIPETAALLLMAVGPMKPMSGVKKIEPAEFNFETVEPVTSNIFEKIVIE